MPESAPQSQGAEKARGPTPPLTRKGRTVTQRAAGFLARSSRRTVVTLCVLLLVLIGWLDYLTSYEISLLAFYWIPIALATWYLGARIGYGFAVASVATAIGTDIAGGFVPSHPWFLLWAIFSELLSFVALVWLVAKLKELYLEARQDQPVGNCASRQPGGLRGAPGLWLCHWAQLAGASAEHRGLFPNPARRICRANRRPGQGLPAAPLRLQPPDGRTDQCAAGAD